MDFVHPTAKAETAVVFLLILALLCHDLHCGVRMHEYERSQLDVCDHSTSQVEQHYTTQKHNRLWPLAILFSDCIKK